MANIGSLYPLVFFLLGIMAFVIAILILRKDPTNYFNRIFFLIIFSFANYFFWESLIYLTPPIWLANLFRDISLAAAIFSGCLFVFGSMFFWFGLEGTDPKLLVVLSIVSIIEIVLAILSDQVVIAGSRIDYVQTSLIGRIFVYFVPLIFVLIGTAIFLKIYSNATDETLKQKILFVLVGISGITAAILYFAIFRVLGLPDILGDLADLIGCLFHFLGLIFFFAAFRKVS